jgi:radical SAM protein with 4Fe4S-binding SPASM domain
MKIPVLNCYRIYINSNRVSLLLKNEKSLTVTSDGWEILKYCDGSNDIDTIYEIVNNNFEINEEEFRNFLETAERINAIKYIQNFEKVEYEIFGGTKKIIPQSFSLELTNRCNLECSYCYGNYKRAKGIFFDYNKVEPLFKNLRDKGVLIIELTGGEPLLHPHFKDILFLATKFFERINILSNGVLFNDEIFALIEENKNKMYLQISIDGCSEETNYKIRKVKNSWSKTLNAIKKLRDLNVFYRVPFMITTNNLHETVPVCELFRKEKLKNLIFSPVSSSFGRACDSLECKFSNTTKEQLINISFELSEKYPEVFYKPFENSNNLPVERNNCGVGWQHATISPNGIVKSCVLLDENIAIMGNVFEQNIQDIFDSDISSFYANFNKQIDDVSCINCDYKYNCGNCIAGIYVSNVERIKKGKDLCDFAKKIEMNKYFNFVPIEFKI